jgi:hypothetical protein
MSRQFPLAIRIAEVRRELALRKNVYPGWVRTKKMREGEADRHIAIMQDVHDTLVWLQEHEAFFIQCLSRKEEAA